jgi:hypothetical protein
LLDRRKKGASIIFQSELRKQDLSFSKISALRRITDELFGVVDEEKMYIWD